MNLCVGGLPAGISECTQGLDTIRNIVIMKAGTSFADVSKVLNLSEWKKLFNTDLTAFSPAVLDSYERTTDEPTINTTTFGKKKFVREAVPSMVVYVDTNLCDFNEQRAALKGGTYSVVFILENGGIMMTKGDLDTWGGFTANITAAGSDIPLQDAVENSFPIYINFDNVYEFTRSHVFVAEAWNPLYQFPNAMPEGLGAYETVVYDTAGGGTVSVQVNERCGDPALGLVTADFEVLSSNKLTDVTIVASETGDGLYELTIQKDAVPANLDSGDWVTFRVKKGSAPVTFISGKINITAP